jgi:hypothetical protein
MGTSSARWVLLATVLGRSMAMLDSTVVNIASAKIGEDLDAGFGALLAGTAMLPTTLIMILFSARAGRLAEIGGGLIAFALVRKPVPALEAAGGEVRAESAGDPSLDLATCWHCGVEGPQLHPRVGGRQDG